MPTHSASGVSEKYELQPRVEMKRGVSFVGPRGILRASIVVSGPRGIQFMGGRCLEANLHLAPLLLLLSMQNIRSKVFQLTAESPADEHQQQDQLRCQHA